jgi:hypothetical protein
MSIREYSRTHIQEYKGLKPKEVDQSKISIMHPERQQQLQRSKYVYTRILEKNGITTNEMKKNTHNFHNNSHKWNPRMKTMVTKTTMTTNHGAQEPIGISKSIISMAISKENSRKNTHTLQKLTMISNMESLKPRKTKTTFKAMTDTN